MGIECCTASLGTNWLLNPILLSPCVTIYSIFVYFVHFILFSPAASYSDRWRQQSLAALDSDWRQWYTLATIRVTANTSQLPLSDGSLVTSDSFSLWWHWRLLATAFDYLPQQHTSVTAMGNIDNMVSIKFWWHQPATRDMDISWWQPLCQWSATCNTLRLHW